MKCVSCGILIPESIFVLQCVQCRVSELLQ